MHQVHGVEEIVAVRTFRSRLPVRRVRHMDRRSQEVQNNFLTDHIIKFLSGSPVRSPKGRQKRSERPSADRFQAVSDTIARDRRFLPSWTLFAHRSLHLYHATRKTNDAGPDRIVDTFVPFNGLPDLLYEKERCDRNHHGIRWTTTVPVQEALSALLDGLTGEPDKHLMMWSVRKLFCTS